MKTLLAGLAVAAATVSATAAVTIPTTADAQPRYWHGGGYGPRYHAWRGGYYGRYHRYPVRYCEHRRHGRVCYYR